MRIADIVESLNGRDAGKLFLIVNTDDSYSLLVDGKSRKIDKPKKKNNKHLQLRHQADDLVSDKLIKSEKITNNEIRRANSGYVAALTEKGGM